MDQEATNEADFMGGSPLDTNDTVMNGISSPGSSGNNGLNNNEAKRVKLDSKHGSQQNPPSKVIHIRNIPSDVTEAEVIHLGIPFGKVTNVLVLKGKNQAFLEMEDESAAVAMVNYFTNCAATLRDRSVYVQYSTHTVLKTDQTHSNASASAQAALQAAQALSGNTNGSADVGQGGGKYGGNANQSGGLMSGGSNTVLRVVVEHMVYPVTLDVIYQIFSRVGKVLKVVTFTKNNTFQVLIQYPDVVTAQAAKLSVDGQNIYNGCCTLRIEYSKLSNLNVKYNNDKSRDYTNPTLPTGDHVMDSLQQSGMQGGAGGHSVLGSPFFGLANPLSAYRNPGLSAASMSGFAGFALGAGAGSPFSQAGLRFAGASAGGAGMSMGGGGGAAGYGVNSQLQAAVAAAQGSSGGSVLLISNLNEELTECDHLFILFGVYGDVQRVKILFNKKDTALIQMAEPQQAQLVIFFSLKESNFKHFLTRPVLDRFHDSSKPPKSA